MTLIKINPPPLVISNHDVPQHVGCSLGVFGEGVRVYGKTPSCLKFHSDPRPMGALSLSNFFEVTQKAIFSLS
jgi:hypothetical protein